MNVKIDYWPNDWQITTARDYALAQVAAGRFTRHTVRNNAGDNVVEPTLRDGLQVQVDAARINLVMKMEVAARQYWEANLGSLTGKQVLVRLSEFSIYPPGHGMVLHSDVERITTQGNVFVPNANVVLSQILYLNDDFEGGALTFPEQGLSLRPRAGMLVTYPSSQDFPHKVEPILSGNRLSLQRFYGLAG